MLIVQTYSAQSKISGQTFSVQGSPQFFPTRDENGKLIGWSLPHNHFDTDISNFFDCPPEEIP
jgi:hypothetical protein